ncbi:hypothetical protein OSH08_05730 [Kaistia geumhonensis]|uniref:Uncharacterized protein n=1 Tax=Kaistia geumhonensis TaxID=410839 RepID=A0ABU0M5P7_9HYPH|nr:hypothetical protein [Kaistia geumhonensis]MCX5478493.1 hypothetical protein [Kaistia geumhonensis]MDQ0516289.1 hypothetical protein [Kaistia geumhonensis]
MTHAPVHDAGGSKPPLRQRLIGSFRLFFILFIYLWILLGLFVLNQNFERLREGETLALQGFALMNALVLGKVMMLAEHLDFARWLRTRPAIFSILFEALFCTVLFIAFHFVEHWVIGLFRGAAAVDEGPTATVAGVAIIAVVLFVSLIPFFAFKNVTRIIGWPRMRHILFGRPDQPIPGG